MLVLNSLGSAFVRALPIFSLSRCLILSFSKSGTHSTTDWERSTMRHTEVKPTSARTSSDAIALSAPLTNTCINSFCHERKHGSFT